MYFHVSSWKWGLLFPKLCVQRDVHWTFESFGVKLNGVKSRWVFNSKSKENVAWPSIPLQIVPISISQRKLTTDYALRNYRLLRATGNPHLVFSWLAKPSASNSDFDVNNLLEIFESLRVNLKLNKLFRFRFWGSKPG